MQCCKKWRRERDSNPRNGFPFTRFPSVRLQPLGHLSSQYKLKKICITSTQKNSNTTPNILYVF